jgi:hypothetical protein
MIQLALLVAVQLQPDPAVTLTLPLPPLEVNEELVEESAKIQGGLEADRDTAKVILPVSPLKPSTPMAYLVPPTALKVTRLVKVPPRGESSFSTIDVRFDTTTPVKTPRVVSKLLPKVEIVTLPEAGAVQDHHTEAPPELPAMGGSPGSLEAPTLEPVTAILVPVMTVALANMSLTGPATGGGSPACVTLKVCPPMVSVAERELVLVLAVTDQITVPLPVPLAGVQVSQEVSLLLALQLQLELDAVTVTVPLAAV